MEALDPFLFRILEHTKACLIKSQGIFPPRLCILLLVEYVDQKLQASYSHTIRIFCRQIRLPC